MKWEHLGAALPDDLSGATERPNHPGTVDRQNWRRRLPVSVEEIPMPVPMATPWIAAIVGSTQSWIAKKASRA